jgi:PIN domain nuclease of toxin-antitoxin system
LKYDNGKLALPESPNDYVPSRLADLNGQCLEIQMKHVLALNGLAMHHKDPFDRVLIAQSKVEQMPLITDDALIRQYDVEVIW